MDETSNQKMFFISIGIIVIVAIGVVWWLMKNNPPLKPAPQENIQTQTYSSSKYGFAFKHPSNWSVDESYAYDLLGPKEPTIPGVKLYVPTNLTQGTNLSPSQTGISIEVMPNMPSCSAYPFLIQPGSVINETINGATYSTASSTGAGAGNLYEEYIYALPNTDPCVAIRYFIHSTNIANYPEGTVEEYDRAELLKNFNAVRDSLTVTATTSVTPPYLSKQI